MKVKPINVLWSLNPVFFSHARVLFYFLFFFGKRGGGGVITFTELQICYQCVFVSTRDGINIQWNQYTLRNFFLKLKQTKNTNPICFVSNFYSNNFWVMWLTRDFPDVITTSNIQSKYSLRLNIGLHQNKALN